MTQRRRPRTRDEHLFGPGPKRILSIDGGGIRGIVSLGFLERIEALLRGRAGGDAAFRLSDHFDLIGGTSTGALIATALAMGFSVEKLIDIYLELSHRAFRGTRWHGGLLWPKFPTEPLLREIKRQVGEEPLGSDALLTGLAIVAKRLDTGSPWIFHNNPKGRYFNAPVEDRSAVANRDMKLHALLRASTAAPTFYDPEMIAVAQGIEGLFVDGGVSPYNNPALLLFLMATTPAYGYGWKTGEDQMALLSVGTGHAIVDPAAAGDRVTLPALLAANALMSVISDCMWSTQAMLQWLGATARPWRIDGEIGVVADAGPPGGKLFRYERHDLVLDAEWLAREANVRGLDADLRRFVEWDRPENAEELLDIARQAAKTLISDGFGPATTVP
jgi:hypothetical protein